MKKFLFLSLLLVLFSCNETVDENIPKGKESEALTTGLDQLYMNLKNDKNFIRLIEDLKYRSTLFVENVKAFEDKAYLDRLDEKISSGNELTEKEYLQVLSLYGFQSEEAALAYGKAQSSLVDSLAHAYPALEELEQVQFYSIINSLFENSIISRTPPPCHIVCGECYDDIVWDCLVDVGWNTLSGVGTGAGFGIYGGAFTTTLGGILGGLTGYGYGLYRCYRSIRDCDRYVPPGCTTPCGEM